MLGVWEGTEMVAVVASAVGGAVVALVVLVGCELFWEGMSGLLIMFASWDVSLDTSSEVLASETGSVGGVGY